MPRLDRPFAFAVETTDPGSRARAGVLRLPHGDVPTPVFMPVGTVGSVKAVTFDEIAAMDYRLILGNTYHLYLRPGHELVADLGGLHRYQGWEGALLTDSAGFQIFSLAGLTKISDDGVDLRSHLDGSRHFFTPELSMEIQRALGADIVMAFDQCAPYGAGRPEITAAVDRTDLWLRRCVAAFGSRGRATRGGYERVLFGIMQGGTVAEERRRSAELLMRHDLPGYAIGGLSVGEPVPEMREMTELAASLLPADRPRYLMGVGFPDDIAAAVTAGVDMFDCVLPTRMARTGTALTRDGRVVVKNQEYARDERPLQEDCACPVCRRHSRAFLRHMFQAREMLGPMLTTQHNLWFYRELMRDFRGAITAGSLAAHARDVTERWQNGERRRRDDIERRDAR